MNLHISLLPWNRGAFPNVWSFLEDTPKGVTIHYMDEGIDTGDIIVQKELNMDKERGTLSTSYESLHSEMQILFKRHWNKFKRGELTPKPQAGCGTIHYKKELAIFEPLIKDKGWDIPLKELKERYQLFKMRRDCPEEYKSHPSDIFC